jgi:hypothetical protein
MRLNEIESHFTGMMFAGLGIGKCLSQLSLVRNSAGRLLTAITYRSEA